MLVDSHCHLDHRHLAADRDGVIARARAAGVRVMLSVATTLEAVPGVLALAEAEEGVVVSIGVHPHESSTHPLADEAPLLALLDHPKVVAIGEAGLDFHYRFGTPEDQARNFRTHIRACRASGLPLVVHTREADRETADILEDEMARAPFTGVIHCYSSSPELARRALDLGLYLGIGGILTFKRSDELRATVAAAPLDRILLETDAPYLAPEPYRGRRNEPAYVAHTAAKLAEIRGLPIAAIERATTDNFFRLFPRAQRPSEAP
jgi:TatD DNase family protein